MSEGISKEGTWQYSYFQIREFLIGGGDKNLKGSYSKGKFNSSPEMKIPTIHLNRNILRGWGVIFRGTNSGD